jgi:HlyD family secretion protein
VTSIRSGAAAGRGLVTGAVILTAGLAVAACGSTPTAPPTSRVERGSVSQMVSASGALSPVTSQNLGFKNAAQLAELDVKVGDTVKPGQLLARQDPFAYQQALNQQRSLLAQQQAQLDKLTNDITVPDAGRVVDQARQILNKTQDNIDAQDSANRSATQRAEVAKDFASRQVTAAYRQARAQGCPTNGDPLAPGSGDSTPTNPPMIPDLFGSGHHHVEGGGTYRPYCSATTVSALNTARSSYITAKSTYDAAKHTEDTDHTQGEISIAQARSTLVQAQNTHNEAATDRPSDIAAQAALVANQQALLATAQRNLNDTSLFAPVGGTVSAITGTVGEYLAAAGSGTTALAPGTDASIPGVGAAATSDQSGNASSGISATRPGGGFITLNNLNTFQVVVPFEESDAAKVQPNQKVQVTFDAIPDLERDGTVLSVAPNGVNISGVTNYYATVLLTNSDPRLKAGQTAEASVVTNSTDNVLVVPNSAVIKQGANSYVNVPGPDGKPVRKQFQPGAVGDDNTQVISGLNEGDQILLPQAGAAGGGNGGRGAGGSSGGSGGSRGGSSGGSGGG